MLSSTARSSSAPAVRRAYVGPSRRAVHSSTRLLRSSSSIPFVYNSSRLPHPQQSCTVLVLRSQPFSTTPSPNSTRRSRRVHRESLAAANASLTGRIPAFTGSPPAASPAALRLAAKARLGRIDATPANPPEFLEYEPQRNKPSSVFFWSDSANEMDRKLMAKGNYPPPLPKFKHDENQQISKCHPSVWLASAHHLQMMHEGYDRLAFMGDAVAGKCISDLLLNDYYCIAGVMGLLKARLVSNAQFAYFSRIYNIPCKNNENAQGDAFEALVGALYLDGKRDGADVDKIVYQWLKELVEPWLELYINQLSPTQKERVVSLHRAVPIGIAVATSNSPNSSQVMMAWESNIATQMIERRLKRGSQPEKGLLQAAPVAAALEGPTVDAIGTSTAAPEFAETWEQAEEEEPMEEEEEIAEEEEMMENEEELAEEEVNDVKEEKEVQDIKALQDSAAASGKAWPTSKSTPKDLTSEAQRAAEKAEAARKDEEDRLKAETEAETEALRKANEERRQRETQRRKEVELRVLQRQAEEKKRAEEQERKKEEQRRLEVARLEEKLRNELLAARKEAEAAKKKADAEAEIARKKLEQNRPITKAEKRAEKKAQKLEAEWAKFEARKKKLEAESAVETEETAERERIEKEKAEQEKAEQEKAEQEKAEQEKAEQEKAEQEKAEQEKAEKERAEKEKAEKEKVENEKAEKEKVEKKKAEKEKAEKEKEKGKGEKVDKTEDKATYTPPGAKTTPSPVPDQKKIDALIREKEAARAAKIKEEEEQLKFQRLLHDIQEMEDLVIKRRDQTFKNSPYMTEDQKKQFAEGWAQYADQQREKMEKEAGVEVGSTLAYKKPEEVVEEKKESAGLFGKLWGALTGKK